MPLISFTDHGLYCAAGNFYDLKMMLQQYGK